MKRLALTLTLKDDDLPPRTPHTHHTFTGVDDHYHILHFGIPRLLATCPMLRLHLRITGSTPFVPCSFQQAQVPAASTRVAATI